MKRITKTAILAVSAALISNAAHAANWVANDLYLGFVDSSASSDYSINLGPASNYYSTDALGNPTYIGSQPQTWTFALNNFNSVFTSGASGVSVGLVGGQYGNLSVPNDIYASTAAGTVDLSGDAHSSSLLAYGATAIARVSPNLPAASSDLMDPSKSFSTYIAPSDTAQSFYGSTGINPLATINSSGSASLDLWYASASHPYSVIGHLLVNVNPGQNDLTVSLKAVPEPTVLSLLGGAGLLLLTFRRRLSGRNA